MTLHIMQSATPIDQENGNWDAIFSDKDDILLIGEAINLLFTSFQCHTNLGISKARQLYALKEDVEARGIDTENIGSVELIDYEGFVKLTLQQKNIQTWY